MNTRKIFDLEGTLARVDNDHALLLELLDIFNEDYNAQLGSIKQAIAANDASELHKSAHAIKSGLGNLGAMICFDLAFNLENLGRSGTVEGAQPIFEALKEEIERFRKKAAEFRTLARG